jgi:hypothetical protein
MSFKFFFKKININLFLLGVVFYIFSFYLVLLLLIGGLDFFSNFELMVIKLGYLLMVFNFFLVLVKSCFGVFENIFFLFYQVIKREPWLLPLSFFSSFILSFLISIVIYLIIGILIDLFIFRVIYFVSFILL